MAYRRCVALIEVYADIWCPFAHVGLRSLVRRRDEIGRDDVVIRVRAWPLELVNGAPLDPGATAEHVDALRSQVAPDLFAGFDAAHFPRTSLPALALAAAAYRRGDEIGEAVSLGFRAALFEEALDISSPDVLGHVAAAHGMGPSGPEDDEAVRAEWRVGQSRGVKGSPHFFCGQVDAFCPSLVITKDARNEIHIDRNTAMLESFLATCVGDPSS